MNLGPQLNIHHTQNGHNFIIPLSEDSDGNFYGSYKSFRASMNSNDSKPRTYVFEYFHFKNIQPKGIKIVKSKGKPNKKTLGVIIPAKRSDYKPSYPLIKKMMELNRFEKSMSSPLKFVDNFKLGEVIIPDDKRSKLIKLNAPTKIVGKNVNKSKTIGRANGVIHPLKKPSTVSRFNKNRGEFEFSKYPFRFFPSPLIRPSHSNVRFIKKSSNDTKPSTSTALKPRNYFNLSLLFPSMFKKYQKSKSDRFSEIKSDGKVQGKHRWTPTKATPAPSFTPKPTAATKPALGTPGKNLMFPIGKTSPWSGLNYDDDAIISRLMAPTLNNLKNI